ncbi:MAG: DUF4202 domain-containing protein [Leptospiraceae bacterium]|nr:DUF4202 domain-containing protein [Leptospiraceae bacterium]
MNANQIEQAVSKIDQANSADPNTARDADGRSHPAEVLYARRMSAMLAEFEPDATVALRIAAHAQHIRRWEVPRDSYPPGRVGYLQWRTYLYDFHADCTAEILKDCDFDAETIERVSYLLRKKNLTRDAETQTLEDVICLVFLKYYFHDFARKHDRDKIIAIVRKTWRKMSERGQAAALRLPLEEDSLELIQAALNDA